MPPPASTLRRGLGLGLPLLPASRRRCGACKAAPRGHVAREARSGLGQHSRTRRLPGLCVPVGLCGWPVAVGVSARARRGPPRHAGPTPGLGGAAGVRQGGRGSADSGPGWVEGEMDGHGAARGRVARRTPKHTAPGAWRSPAREHSCPGQRPLCAAGGCAPVMSAPWSGGAGAWPCGRASASAPPGFRLQCPPGRAGAALPTCVRRRGTTPSAWTRPPGTCGAWGTRTTRRGEWAGPGASRAQSPQRLSAHPRRLSPRRLSPRPQGPARGPRLAGAGAWPHGPAGSRPCVLRAEPLAGCQHQVLCVAGARSRERGTGDRLARPTPGEGPGTLLSLHRDGGVAALTLAGTREPDTQGRPALRVRAAPCPGLPQVPCCERWLVSGRSLSDP